MKLSRNNILFLFGVAVIDIVIVFLVTDYPPDIGYCVEIVGQRHFCGTYKEAKEYVTNEKKFQCDNESRHGCKIVYPNGYWEVFSGVKKTYPGEDGWIDLK